MKKSYRIRFSLLYVLMTYGLGVCFAQESKPEVEQEMTVPVKRVIDGDSILVSDPTDSSKEMEVQLEGIDAPELKQEFGKEASSGLSKIIDKKNVRITWKSKDNYGRLLGQVYLEKLHVNSEMLKQGLAWHFKRYNKSEELAKVEEEARGAKRGLWTKESPVAPWDYRRENRAPDKPDR